jgi:glucosylceramidase
MIARMSIRSRTKAGLGVALALFTLASMPANAEWKAKIRTTTDAARWTAEAAVRIDPKGSPALSVDVDTATKYQTIDGFGGCFNEIGWKALQSISPQSADSVIRSLFDTTNGCKFNICRMPIGASDYALGWYSLNDNVNDTLMTKISIARDTAFLLHYIKAAMTYRPELKVWGSPWSPPEWMKTNNSYLGGQISWNPAILRAYALYLEKAVQLYRAQGINFYALSFQNESTLSPAYPGCQWDANQHRDFIKFYLGPKFNDDQLNCEIWTPTMNCELIAYFDPMLSDPLTSTFITTICFQWNGKNVLNTINTKYPYPQFKRYQTETECGDGTNTWAYAVDPTFRNMKFFFDGWTGAYMQWNMVLDQTGFSHWNWAQNAMITIDTTNKKVIYNPQYFVAKHFSYYVKANAKKIKSSGNFTDQVAFRNPDGAIVVVLSNSSPSAASVSITFGSSMINVTLPKTSFSTAVIYDSTANGVIYRNSVNVGRMATVKVVRTGNDIVFTPSNTQSFDLQVLGINGAVKASFSSLKGGVCKIKAHEMQSGMYVLKGLINGKRYFSTLPIINN